MTHETAQALAYAVLGIIEMAKLKNEKLESHGITSQWPEYAQPIDSCPIP